MDNGNLILPPFRASDYKQEVHAQVSFLLFIIVVIVVVIIVIVIFIIIVIVFLMITILRPTVASRRMS